jgi:seryl-tRNA synthetase
MKFQMSASLLLSGKVDEKAVESAVEESKPLLSKGAPEGKGAVIDSCAVSGDTISIKISSGRYVRPHDAIMRINKYLSSRLGKEQKVGIRQIVVDNYEIWYELKQEPLEEIALPFTEKIEIKDREAHLVLKDIDQQALEDKYVDRLLKRLDEKISQQHMHGKAEYVETVKRSKKRLDKYKITEDPTTELVKNNWVQHAGVGVWTILPQYTALMRAVEELVLDNVANPLGFDEVFLPKITNLDIQRKKGQLAGIPNEIWWVCPPKSRDPKQWEEFSDYVKITGKNAPEKLLENLAEPAFSLAYAQCEPFYDIWEGRVINRDKLPVKFVDRYGPTWRYESGGLKGLERVSEFKRIEFMWISSPEEAVEIRDAVKDKALHIVDKIFDLEWKLDTTTAIYLEHAGEKATKEDRDYARTYDIAISLPFETASRAEKELEIASFHVHEDFYAKNFHWKEKNERPLWSGCTGISPTRWAYVFVLRYGLNFDDWPKEIKKYIGKKLPRMPDGLFV